VAEPITVTDVLSDHSLNLAMYLDIAKDGQHPPNIYDPDMKLDTSDSDATHVFISSNTLNHALWAASTSGIVDLVVSQALLDKFKIDLLKLTTDNLSIMFGNILNQYKAGKGVYIELQLPEYNPANTRLQLRQGSLDALLSAKVTMYVDKDSSKYPQKDIKSCTACEKAVTMNADVFLSLRFMFTDEDSFTFDNPDFSIYSVTDIVSTFPIDKKVFMQQASALVPSLTSGIPKDISFKNTILAQLNPSSDEVGDLMHIAIQTEKQ